MKKIEFELSDSLYEQSLLPIRSKRNLLDLLSHAIKFLVSSPIPHVAPRSDEKKLVLYVDKMSRLLFCVKDKIFTFNFPLQVDIPIESTTGYLSLHYKELLQIDSMVSSLLLSIFSDSQCEVFDGPLESLGERIIQEVIDNDDWIGIDSLGLSELIKHFIFFEPGYLRYDYDPKHANGKLHPEHHLDIFFSSSNTMKVGLQRKIDKSWMLDLLDTNTDCKYIL